jgi:hypothetical protein
MPDNWGYVMAAYAVAALVLGAYWRRLGIRRRTLLRGATAGTPEGRRR